MKQRYLLCLLALVACGAVYGFWAAMEEAAVGSRLSLRQWIFFVFVVGPVLLLGEGLFEAAFEFVGGSRIVRRFAMPLAALGAGLGIAACVWAIFASLL